MGESSEYLALKILEAIDKAKKWDAYEADSYHRAMDFSKEWIEVDELRELREKARKWDTYLTGGPIMDLNKSLIETNKLKQLEEKSKKWDDHLAVNASKGVFPNPLVEEWKDKAEKWDGIILDFAQKNTNYNIRELNHKMVEWKEKARLYDEGYTNLLQQEDLRELREKAKSWDDMFKDGSIDDVLKWKEKAEKYDDLFFRTIQLENAMDDLKNKLRYLHLDQD